MPQVIGIIENNVSKNWSVCVWSTGGNTYFSYLKCGLDENVAFHLAITVNKALGNDVKSIWKWDTYGEREVPLSKSIEAKWEPEEGNWERDIHRLRTETMPNSIQPNFPDPK